MGETRLLNQISNLGFGKPTGLLIPGESQGLVPGPSHWTGTSIGSTPIGQDDAVTAQQVIDAYNAVANGGVFVFPRLIRATVDTAGSVTAAATKPSRRVIDPATNAQLTNMLESVVSTGTGTSATIFREGERNVGLQVLADITRLCPELYARMAGETQKEM